MQSNTSRVALIAGALAVLVVAFIVLRPGGDDDPEPTSAGGQAPAGESESGGTAERPGSGASGDQGSSGAGEQASQPVAAQIRIEDGEVVGGAREIEVERGDRVELVVRSDAADQIHLHGYDITRDVEPGDPARFGFSADSEGVYELEAHDLGHVVIGELRVTPS